MMIEMHVSGLTLDPHTNMPILILKDEEGTNVVPIWIGIIEASAIATELEKIQLARPMTHDLMRNILGELDVVVDRIEVTDLRDNTFFAVITLIRNGEMYHVDARPSDAIALALRTQTAIFVDQKVIEKSKKVDLSGEKETDKGDKDKWTELLENLSPEDFGKWKM